MFSVRLQFAQLKAEIATLPDRTAAFRVPAVPRALLTPGKRALQWSTMSNKEHKGKWASASIRSECSQLFPSLLVFAACMLLLFLPGAKPVERSSRDISLEKVSHVQTLALASDSSSQPPSLADANCQLQPPSVMAGRKRMHKDFGSSVHTGHIKHLL